MRTIHKIFEQMRQAMKTPPSDDSIQFILLGKLRGLSNLIQYYINRNDYGDAIDRIDELIGALSVLKKELEK